MISGMICKDNLQAKQNEVETHLEGLKIDKSVVSHDDLMGMSFIFEL